MFFSNEGVPKSKALSWKNVTAFTEKHKLVKRNKKFSYKKTVLFVFYHGS